MHASDCSTQPGMVQAGAVQYSISGLPLVEGRVDVV
jgi:hypothetical protein